MLDQLTQLAKQFGLDSVVNNVAIPNDKNDAVINETSNSVLSGLQQMASQEGGMEQLAGLFKGGSIDNSNPVVKQITNHVTGNLGSKLGISGDAASGVASSMIPQILGSLIGKAQNPNDSSIGVQDILGAITSGSNGGGGGIMDAISKYGGMFGLDQNADGKVDMGDAISAVSKKSGGLGGLLGGLFGK